MDPLVGPRRRRFLRAGLVVLATSLLALLSSELVLRTQSDLTLGFTYRNGVFSHPQENEGDARTNSLGFHDLEPQPEQPGRRRVLLVGDSYVAGLAVTLEHTVGHQLELALNERATDPYDVVALGQPGWGQRQELEALRKHFDELRPEIVCLLFLSFNDVRNNAPEGPIRARAGERRDNPDRARPGWVHLARDEVPLFLCESSKLNQLLSFRLARLRARDDKTIPLDYFVYRTPVDADWEAAWLETERLIGEMQSFTEQRGARFLLASASTQHGVLGPEQGLRLLRANYPAMHESSWDLTLPDRRLAGFAARAGFSFLALESVIGGECGARAHLRFDGHWSALGHAAAGRALAAFLLDSEDRGSPAR